MAFLYAWPTAWPAAAEFQRRNWGNLISTWGLGVSIGALIFAKGAKKAAEEARSAERLSTALASLEAALVKCLEIGQLAGAQKWPAVEIRAQEVLQVCHTTLAAWGDKDALTDSRRRLSEVATLMRSIVEETRNATVNTKTVLKAQLDAHVKLSVVVGKIQKAHTSGSV